MKKELREQIKRDELVTGFQNAAAWAQAHQQELRIAVGVAVLVGAAAAGLAYVQGNRQREAERAFMEAVAIYEAPVASELAREPTSPPAPSSRTPRRSTRPRPPPSTAWSGATAPCR